MAEQKLKKLFSRTLVREPLLQFIVLGGVIFSISGWAENQRQNLAGTIRVDTKLQTRLENLYSTQFGYSPSPEVLKNLRLDGEIQTEAPEETLRTWCNNHLANYEKPPRFLLQAVKDPDGANLDRIQMIRIWIAGGEVHEKVFDALWNDNL